MISKVKTIEGEEVITAYSVEEFEPDQVHFSKSQRNKKTYLYSDTFLTLDTETSHINEEIGWIYQWAVKMGDKFVYGRTPVELIQLLVKMKEFYKLSATKKFIIYIHNSSYDIQYLKHYLYQYDEAMSVFALDNHAILIVDILGFRILCSYKMSNMSLDLFSRTYSSKYVKAVGEIDYSIVRYQDEGLTDTDWFYMFSDVASQYDAISEYLKIQGYNKCWQAPFTSTGFVRTDCRHRAEKELGWRNKFLRSQLSREQYNLCHQAFMGGLTIANYKVVGETIRNKKLGHKDFTSSYPARQMMDYFPVGKGDWYGEVDDQEEFNHLLDNYCCVFSITLNNVRIKDGITAPYIPSSKCLHLENELKLNGKVVFADTLTIVITEIDYKWIKRQYDAEIDHIDNMLLFRRGEAPKWLKNAVMHYYNNKCTLKNSDPKLYMSSKALLNAIYGMSATAIVRPKYEVIEDLLIRSNGKPSQEEIENQINKFYSSYNSFMPYQLGIYTTAHSRDALMTMIEAVGYDNFLYCDTDSVFYISTPEAEKNLEEMNKKIKARAIEKGAFIGDNYLGYATDEAPIRAFRCLHAKCYAMEEYDKKSNDYKLRVTIAGIPKQSTKWIKGKPVIRTNADELGTIDNLKDGFTFKHCGGTRAIYNECPITEIRLNGHEITYSSSVIIDNIEKEINDTMFSVGKDYSLINFKITQKAIE